MMRPPDRSMRDRALMRTRSLRWLVALLAAGVSVAGTAAARAAFSGHNKRSTATFAHAARASVARVVDPLPQRAVPNRVPLPPHVQPAPVPSTPPSSPAVSQTSDPQPVPAPAPVVTSSS